MQTLLTPPTPAHTSIYHSSRLTPCPHKPEVVLGWSGRSGVTEIEEAPKWKKKRGKKFFFDWCYVPNLTCVNPETPSFVFLSSAEFSSQSKENVLSESVVVNFGNLWVLAVNPLPEPVLEISGVLLWLQPPFFTAGISLSDSTSSSKVISNWNLSVEVEPGANASPDRVFFSWPTVVGSGLWGIMLWYHSLLSSSVSRISWASGWTKSAHVSHKGWTM